jgi:hypothetical protein
MNAANSERAALGADCGYHLATISGKILVVKSASFDGKTALPNWNSLKNQRIDLCLSAVRRIPPSPPDLHRRSGNIN